MICEMCKKNNASVHIVRLVNGIKQTLNICESCAKQSQGLSFIGEAKLESPFTFQSILSGMVDYINQSSHSIRNTEVVCPNCGMTYGEFKQYGYMGCETCYRQFSSTIMPVIKRVQGNTEHVGKMPVKSGKEIMEKKRLMNLKEELQKAILEEEYEKAAEIRDRIRELQKNEDSVK
jgi:protein arginine kinase activator